MRARIYPDTNVALHYRPFTEIDRYALAGADEVELVINVIFLRELDHHKNHARRTLQNRARRVVGWLGSIRRGVSEVRPGVRVLFELADPELELNLASYGLVATVNDDKFLACILRDRTKYPGMNLICVTADIALAVKAEGLGVQVVKPPDECKLAEEPDEAQMEIRALRKQIVELASRAAPAPDLIVAFAGGVGHLADRDRRAHSNVARSD